MFTGCALADLVPSGAQTPEVQHDRGVAALHPDGSEDGVYRGGIPVEEHPIASVRLGSELPRGAEGAVGNRLGGDGGLGARSLRIDGAYPESKALEQTQEPRLVDGTLPSHLIPRVEQTGCRLCVFCRQLVERYGRDALAGPGATDDGLRVRGLARCLDGFQGRGEFGERVLGGRWRIDRPSIFETIDLLVSRLDVPLLDRAVDDGLGRLIHSVVAHVPQTPSDGLDALLAENLNGVVDFEQAT